MILLGGKITELISFTINPCKTVLKRLDSVHFEISIWETYPFQWTRSLLSTWKISKMADISCLNKSISALNKLLPYRINDNPQQITLEFFQFLYSSAVEFYSS